MRGDSIECILAEPYLTPCIGLIIQGPLVTYGQGPNNMATGFNTLEAIEGNIKECIKRNIPFCISTWKPTQDIEVEILDKLVDIHAHAIILVPPDDDPDHRLKHHFGIRRAMDVIQTPYVVKVRTDMLVPTQFWDWLEDHLDDKLIVSELFMPFYVGDFIYASSRTTMLRFLDGFLGYKNTYLHPSITTDIGFKLFEIMSGVRISKHKMLLHYSILRRHTTHRWEKFAAEHIRVLPADIFNKLFWRGRQIDSVINTKAFKFDTSPNYPSMEIKFLLDEYLRFFTKKNYSRRHLITLLLFIYKNCRRIIRLPLKIYLLIFKPDPAHL